MKYAILAVSVAAISAAGCGGPPSIINAAPPGVDPEKVNPRGVEDEAYSIGENATRAGLIDPERPRGQGEAKPIETSTTKSGVKRELFKKGKGPEVKESQEVTVHYIGTLDNGRVFANSKQADEPYTFKVGAAQAIKGWDEGIVGMHVGDVARFTIPPELAYGPDAQPDRKTGVEVIPANATLTFEIEVLATADPTPKD